jgi:hypothetical protein
MAKRLREVIEASNPLSRKRTADLLKKLASLLRHHHDRRGSSTSRLVAAAQTAETRGGIDYRDL